MRLPTYRIINHGLVQDVFAVTSIDLVGKERSQDVVTEDAKPLTPNLEQEFWHQPTHAMNFFTFDASDAAIVKRAYCFFPTSIPPWSESDKLHVPSQESTVDVAAAMSFRAACPWKPA